MAGLASNYFGHRTRARVPESQANALGVPPVQRCVEVGGIMLALAHLYDTGEDTTYERSVEGNVYMCPYLLAETRTLAVYIYIGPPIETNV